MEKLKIFRRLYVSTLFAPPLLDRFWQAAMYDLDGEAFGVWCDVRKEIEQNAQKQQDLLKQMFDDLLLTEKELNLDDLVCLLEDFPELIQDNEKRLQSLVTVLPRETESRRKLENVLEKNCKMPQANVQL